MALHMVSRVVPIALNYFPRACSSFAALTRYILLPSFPTTYPSMQALRLARHSVPLRCSLVVRSLATTANPTHVTSSTTSASSSSTTKSPSVIPLSNIEAQWEAMSKEDQVTVHQQLEVLQKKDWKELSLDEKKAGKLYGVASVAPGCSIYFTCPLATSFLRSRMLSTSVLRSLWSLRSPSSRDTTWSTSQSILIDHGSRRCCWALILGY